MTIYKVILEVYFIDRGSATITEGIPETISLQNGGVELEQAALGLAIEKRTAGAFFNVGAGVFFPVSRISQIIGTIKATT